MKTVDVNYENLGNGAAKQLVERELARVLENLLDPSTDHAESRSIGLKVVFTTDKSRKSVRMAVDVKSKLASAERYESTAFIDTEGGMLSLKQQDPNQQSLFDGSDTGRPAAERIN